MNVRRHNRLIYLLAAFLMMAAGTACVEPINVTPPEMADEVELSFQIDLPSAEIMTKADVDPVVPEARIKSLWIWAFTNGGDDDEWAVGYANPMIDSDGWDDPSGHTITMKLRSAVVNSTNPKLDFYALANGEAVGFTATKKPKRQALKEALIEDVKGAGFGTGTACVSEVPEAGLPMTACYTGFDISFLRLGFTAAQIDFIKDNPQLNPQQTPKPDGFSDAQWIWARVPGNWAYDKVSPKMDLERAVAKIRFVFAKAETMTAEAQITSIELGYGDNFENMLPVSTYLFPRGSESPIYPEGTGYESFSWTGASSAPLVTNSQLLTVDTPLRLRKDSEIETGGTKPKVMTPQQYEDFLTSEIETGNKPSTQKLLYLRESDKSAVKCKIGYQFKKTGETDFGTVNYTTIDIPRDPGTQQYYRLTRNTWWTVYAYFISYELGFQVTVMPWDGVGSSENTYSHLQ